MVTLFDGDICQNDDFLKILGSLADDTEACSWIRDKSIRYKLIDGTYAGFYPLQLAALNQKSKYVEKLLTFFKHGEYYTLKHVCTSFVEIKSKEYKKYNGFNIFHLAAYNGDYESFNTIIKKLLEIKALKEVKQEKDPTKKVVGAEEFKKNKPKEVWGVALIPVGCEEEPTTKNYTSQDNFKDAKYVGFNIFHLATYNGKIPFLIKTLSIKTLKHEAFKKTVLEDNKKFSGYSVLHLAARKNYLKTTKWLVENGANVMVVDKAGKTAFDVAKEARKDAVSKYLEEAMRLPRALILFKSKLLKLTLSLQP